MEAARVTGVSFGLNDAGAGDEEETASPDFHGA